MDGPEFLVCYATAIAALAGICHWRNRRHDPWHGRALPALPETPDPYRIAWLRGGGREVIRLAIYELLYHQRLGIVPGIRPRPLRQPNRVSQLPGEGDGEPLAPLAQEVLRAIAGPVDPVSLLKGRLPDRIDERCSHFAIEFRDQGLLLAPGMRTQAWLGTLLAIAAILAIGGWRLAESLAHGHHNVFGLFFCAIAGSILVLAVGAPRPRLTLRGRDYLRRMELAFAQRQPATPPKRWTPAAAPQAVEAGTAGMATPAGMAPDLLMVALLGVGALEGTRFGQVAGLFPQAARQRGSDGGSSCSSSTSCGSSDSGGGSGGGDGGSGCGGGGCGGGGD